MRVRHIQPPDWAKPRGYSNGVLVEGARRMLFIAGQVAWDAQEQIVGGTDFAAQFRQALQNVATILHEAGGLPEHIVRMTIYVADKEAYVASLKGVGIAYREVLGRNFPAMSLVEVSALLEEGAMVEIEATAAMP